MDVEKAFDKIQYPFIIKILERLGIQGTHLNIIKTIYYMFTASINLNVWKCKEILPKSRTRQSCPLSPYLFNIVLEVLASIAKGAQGETYKRGKSENTLICRYDCIHKWS